MLVSFWTDSTEAPFIKPELTIDCNRFHKLPDASLILIYIIDFIHYF